jgi:hypothetical protein
MASAFGANPFGACTPAQEHWTSKKNRTTKKIVHGHDGKPCWFDLDTVPTAREDLAESVQHRATQSHTFL